MFEPEVDRDRFDIVLSDADFERHVQVKTVSSRKNEWPIARRLLSPSVYVTEALDFEPMKSGLNGGCWALWDYTMSWRRTSCLISSFNT
jgi:hypothetical protein